MGLLVANTFICLFLILNELVPIYQKKQWLPFWIYTVLMSFEYILVFLCFVGIKIPSPAAPIKRIVSAILGY